MSIISGPVAYLPALLGSMVELSLSNKDKDHIQSKENKKIKLMHLIPLIGSAWCALCNWHLCWLHASFEGIILQNYVPIFLLQNYCWCSIRDLRTTHFISWIEPMISTHNWQLRYASGSQRWK